MNINNNKNDNGSTMRSGWFSFKEKDKKKGEAAP